MREVVYALTGMAGLCFFLKFLLDRMYHRLLREAVQMGQSKHPLMKMLVKKFEACYQLKMGVGNVEIFVEKYLNEYKVAGTYLHTWKMLSDLSFGATLLGSILVSLYMVLMGMSREMRVQFLLFGTGICTILILEDIFLDVRRSRQKVTVEIWDYLENVLKPRLENQTFKSKEMEEYHREYFDEEREELEQLLEKKQEEQPPLKIHFTKEEEAVIEEVLKEYI
jgi:hypothetical protein